VKRGYPLIKAKEIGGGRIDFETCDQISREEHLAVIARSKPELGDTLFAHIGASLGEAAYVNTDREFSIKNIALFKPNSAVIDGKYLYYLIVSPQFQAMAKGAKTGSAQPFLSLHQLRNHQLLYQENLTVQRRVAGILFAYDDLIEHNIQRVKILEQMAHALYTEWFVNRRFPGHEKVKLIDSESSFGEIPEGWKIKKLGDFVQIRKEGVNPKALDPASPYIGIEHLPRRSWSFDLYSSAEEAGSNKLKFYKHDILFGNIRPYFHKVLLSPLDGICSSDIIVLKAKDPKYLALAFSVVYSDQFIAQATTTSKGTKMPRADWNALIEYPILVPAQELIETFTLVINPLYELAVNINSRNKSLKTTRNLLIPKLVTGEIEV
jgi:type I restriction enzyme, S subunit